MAYGHSFLEPPVAHAASGGGIWSVILVEQALECGIYGGNSIDILFCSDAPGVYPVVPVAKGPPCPTPDLAHIQFFYEGTFEYADTGTATLVTPWASSCIDGSFTADFPLPGNAFDGEFRAKNCDLAP